MAPNKCDKCAEADKLYRLLKESMDWLSSFPPDKQSKEEFYELNDLCERAYKALDEWIGVNEEEWVIRDIVK